MNQKNLKGWLKHWDFIVIDILCLQLCFVLAYWAFHGVSNPYLNRIYSYQAAILFVSQLVVIMFTGNYGGILRRSPFDEAKSVLIFTASFVVVALVYMFIVHTSSAASRLQFGFTATFYVVLDYILRTLNKMRLLRSSKSDESKKSIVLITSTGLVKETIERLYAPGIYHDYFVSGVVVLDSKEPPSIEGVDVPIMPMGDEAIKKLLHGWVDEVFIMQPSNTLFPAKLMDLLVEMGLTVNYSLSAMGDYEDANIDVGKLGNFKVFKRGIRFATPGQIALKRVIDILGGIVGCIITGIIFIFVAPMIYAKSPGPIFFVQERVGQNGKTFKMYKFRSMYLDAEERKKELLDQNKVEDGMMFKLDDDPRIIGSEKKDAHGRPCGIGNFIRRTSLDEFPQFFNVLKGDMSLVGWRPCTVDEWNKYKLQHRVRASMKPGLTGMWQVSGRSEVTDFSEVVRLDREYLENWSIGLDIKIILKTVSVVLSRRGAE